MNYLIIKVEDEYLGHRDYLWDEESHNIFSVRKRNFVTKSYVEGNYYVTIKKRMFSLKKLIKWNQEYYLENDIKDLKFIEDQTRRCTICTLYRKLFEFKDNGNICKICLNRNNLYKNKKAILRETDKDYREADDFLMKMKAKKWLATELDIFKLIDIYERYYPQATLGEGIDEDKAIKILEKIIRKHIRKANEFS